MFLRIPLYFLEMEAPPPVCLALKAGPASKAKTFPFSSTVKTFQKDQPPEAGVLINQHLSCSSQGQLNDPRGSG